MFDDTPISATNPVVARIDETIEIPLSELTAYQRAERQKALTDRATLAQKRAVLDELVDVCLLVDQAHRTGVASSPAFQRRMEATRTMMLADALANQTATSAPGGTTSELADRLFDAATIDVSNEAYALVRQFAAEIDRVTTVAHLGPTLQSPAAAAEHLSEIVRSAPLTTVVRYDGNGALQVRELLAIYAGLPTPRPDVQTHDGFLALIKPLIVPRLMALRAAGEGYARDPAFVRRLERNGNVLLRFHMQGAIEAEANRRIHSADIERQLHRWFDAHREQYRVGSAEGRLASFGEARPRVEADYSVSLIEQLTTQRAQRLRAGRRIVVDERVLDAWKP